MPTGYKWTTKGWVKRRTREEIDYEKFADDAWGLLVSYWRWYPDRLLDVLESEHADYSLALVQRMNLRLFARYQDAFVTGSRGTTKTYTAFLGEMLDGVLWPGTVSSYFGPSQRQTAKLAADAFRQISKNYPGLAAHWLVKAQTKEKFEIRTQYGSILTVSAMRGDNCTQVLAEEVGQENLPQFDHQTFRAVVLPAVRIQHMVGKEPDELHVDFKHHYITSASRQQNGAYEYRCDILQGMAAGESCYAIDYPWQVAVLCGIRNIQWAKDLKRKLTPEEWLREMESRYTGTSENPVLRDAILTESKQLQVMELEHCGDPACTYVVAYDVSYEDGARNAKCATAVWKLTPQREFIKRDRYRKELVYVEDAPPPISATIQAQRLKQVWARYCMAGGGPTYIAIDGWQYGKSVVENLMKDLRDGLPPLCCRNHQYQELELEGALGVIYPIKATGGAGGVHDPDSEMLRYAELEWEHHNVFLLVTDVVAGVEAYKRFHRVKDDNQDVAYAVPYQKTKELCGQISNLKRKVSGTGTSEVRISKNINRDMWSAAKYGLRLAQLLEQEELRDSVRRKSQWAEEFKRAGAVRRGRGLPPPRVQGYRGGRLME